MSEINAKQIVHDIRAGLSDAALIEKLRLSTKGFQRLLQLLVDNGAIEHLELYEKSPLYRSMTDSFAARGHPRVRVRQAIKVCSNDKRQCGYVRDLSANGLRIAGIDTVPGETLSLRVSEGQVPGARGLQFNALCRWTQGKGKIKTYTTGGLEISEISHEDRARWFHLIDLIRSESADEDERRSEDKRVNRLPDSTSHRKQPADSRLFSGTVQGVDILDFVQFLLLAGKTMVLQVRPPDGDSCEIHLEDGRIVHAVRGGSSGQEALFDCLKLTTGVFSTAERTEGSERTISEPGDWLLMEAALRRDQSAMGKSSSESEPEPSAIAEPLTYETFEPTGSSGRIPHMVGGCPIYDIEDSMNEGSVLEISGEAFTVVGLRARVGERKNLLVYLADLVETKPLSFEVECMWADIDNDGNYVAQFAVTEIPQEGMDELNNLLKWVAFLE